MADYPNEKQTDLKENEKDTLLKSLHSTNAFSQGRSSQPAEKFVDRKGGCILPQRVILSIMGSFASLNALTMRLSLSMAITRIAKSPNYNVTEIGTSETFCPAPEVIGNGNSTVVFGEYDWSESLQGMILSSFYIGYLFTHLPGGILAEKFGGKWVLGLGILSTALFTLITPYSIHTGGATALIILRVLMGLGEGVTFPALTALISQWVPAKERSQVGSFVFSGGAVGVILCNIVSGFIMDSYSWEMVFYVFGTCGVIWFLIFVPLCYSNPDSHPFITPREKAYLKREMGSILRKTTLPPVPWLAIITNKPVLALIAGQIAHDWSIYVMITNLPKYMDNVLRFSIKENGIFSSIPFVANWIVALISGYLSDFIINKGIVDITTSRKWFTGFANIVPAIFMISASYAGCNRLLVVILFTSCIGALGTFLAGMKLNPLDLSPNYAGTLMAITNGIGSITGIITPYLIGVLTPNATVGEWRLVFWITSGMLVSMTVVYSIWSSGEVQPFNEPNTMDDKVEHGKSPIRDNQQK